MNILFFQNCVSPHQMPYISLLPTFQEIDDVVVVVPEIDMALRKAMGWDASVLMNTAGVNFVVAPSVETIQELFERYTDTDTWCVFSGINSFVSVIHWFRSSLKYKVRRCLMTEPPLIYNHPLWQHALRFALKDWRYVKYIDKVFVMGDEFVSYYRFWSNKWNVYPFIYCTEWKDRVQVPNSAHVSKKLKILYVGALSHRKNVQLLLHSVESLERDQQSQLLLGLVGDGDQIEQLKKQVQSENFNTEIFFYGIHPMDKVASYMEQYDILCLPSLHDGWGAVVNEALTLGLYVICSDHCGAQYLIKQSNGRCGCVFKSNDANSLKQVLLQCIVQQNELKQKINERINWARNHIHGEIVARYFIEKLEL